MTEQTPTDEPATHRAPPGFTKAEQARRQDEEDETDGVAVLLGATAPLVLLVTFMVGLTPEPWRPAAGITLAICLVVALAVLVPLSRAGRRRRCAREALSIALEDLAASLPSETPVRAQVDDLAVTVAHMEPTEGLLACQPVLGPLEDLAASGALDARTRQAVRRLAAQCARA